MKNESWQNPEILSRVENMASKLIFLTTAEDKIFQIPEISSRVEIWLKSKIFNHSAPVKDEIVQNPDIFSLTENDFGPAKAKLGKI